MNTNGQLRLRFRDKRGELIIMPASSIKGLRFRVAGLCVLLDNNFRPGVRILSRTQVHERIANHLEHRGWRLISSNDDAGYSSAARTQAAAGLEWVGNRVERALWGASRPVDPVVDVERLMHQVAAMIAKECIFEATGDPADATIAEGVVLVSKTNRYGYPIVERMTDVSAET